MRIETSKRCAKAWAAACALILLSQGTPPTRGDGPIKGRTLLDVARLSRVILTGQVARVTTDRAGTQQAVVNVKRTLRGRVGQTVTVLGSTRDPDEARFNPDRNVLLFLTPTRAAGTYRCVRGAAGKFSYLPAEEARVTQLAEEYAKYSSTREQPAAAREGHRQVVRGFIAAPLRDRRFTAGLLEEFGADISQSDADWLEERARDERGDPTVRAWAVRHLGRLRAKGAAPTISGLVNSPQVQVRGAAVRALGELGAVEHEGAVLKALEDPAPGVRQAAAEALGMLKSPNAVRALMKRLDEEPSAVVRVAIVTSVGVIPGEEARAADARLGGASLGARLKRVTRGGDGAAEARDRGDSPEARPAPRLSPEPRPPAPSDDPARSPRQAPTTRSDDPSREED